MKTSACLALLALACLALCPFIGGCAGGCGESAEEQNRVLPDRRAKLGQTQGGGPAEASRFDSAAKDEKIKDARGQAEAQASSGTAAHLAPFASIGEVDASNFKKWVLRPGATVLLLVYGPECGDCEVVAPVILELSREFKGRIDFFQLDGFGLGHGGLLPEGITLSPLPAFAIFKSSRPASRRQGLPFPREQAPQEEALEAYRARLKRWFKDALTQRDLDFAGR